MFRRWIFLSLTAVLVAVLAWLVFRSYSADVEGTSTLPAGEIVRESKPSCTRVIGPVDLEVVESSVEFQDRAPEGSAQSPISSHSVTIRNTGSVPYHDLVLEFEYQDASGRALGTAFHRMLRAVLPGDSIAVSEIRVERVPSGATMAMVKVAYADIGPQSDGAEQQ